MKKNIFYFKIISFTVFFRFVIVKLLLIGTAVHFDGLFAVSLSGDFFSRLFKFEVSIITS